MPTEPPVGGFTPRPGQRYDMPVVFGASQVPGQTTVREIRTIAHSFLTDPAAVTPLVPYHFSLPTGPAKVTVSSSMNLGVDWLGGRDYHVVRVMVDVSATCHGEVIRAPYHLVLWESDAHPVIAGREFQGYAKLVGEIPAHEHGERTAAFECSEYGTLLLRVEATNLVPVADEVLARRAGVRESVAFGWKYIPGPAGTVDVDYPTRLVGRGELLAMSTGTSTLSFGSPTWQQCPFSARIIETLAALPVLDVLPAVVSTSTGLLDRDAVERLS